MGGWIFVLSPLVAIFFLKGDVWQGIFVFAIMLSYAFLGFLDDFIKVRFHKNEGLKPYQKIIGQVGIGLIIGFYRYFFIGSDLSFFGLQINLSWAIIPFVVVFFVAITNSVNLTDGLDGLAGGVSFIYLICFGVILAILGSFDNLAVISFSCAGGVLGFLLFNGYPAKIFMGDTGSLALGGVIGALASFSKLELFVPILGVMFVASALSDILQVAYYKKTKKRIFKMAPLHHHFERCGVHENKIVLSYVVITFVCGLALIVATMFFKGVL